MIISFTHTTILKEIVFNPQGTKRKGKGKAATAAKKKRMQDEDTFDFKREFLAMQTRQAEMFEAAERRQEELLVKLEADQRKADAEARKSDQEFLLKLAELFAKP